MHRELTRTVREWNIGGSQIRWSAVFAGFVVGVASQMVLSLLVLAIGAWSIDLQCDLAPLRRVFTFQWNLSWAVVWGVTWLVFAWLTTTAMATMIGGLFSAFGSDLQSIGRAAGQGVSTAVSKVGPMRDWLN